MVFLLVFTWRVLTKVPVLEALEVIRDLLENDDTLHQRTNFSVEVLCDLSKFCLTSCYFVFNDKFFIQSDGVAMGSSLGCVVANIYVFF